MALIAGLHASPAVNKAATGQVSISLRFVYTYLLLKNSGILAYGTAQLGPRIFGTVYGVSYQSSASNT